MLHSSFGRFLIPLVLALFFIRTSSAFPQEVPEFYVSAVEDARENRDALRVMRDTESGRSGAMAGAGITAIRNRIRQAFPGRHGLHQVVVQVRELSLSERPQAAGRILGQVAVTLRFLLQKEHELIPLTTISRQAVYSRGLTGNSVPLSALNQVLDNGMKDFQTWMGRESATNVRLARAVQFRFRNHSEQHEDTVYYAPDRPLTWADFRDSPKSNRFAAEVFAGFGFDQELAVKNGVIEVTITTRVFVPKSASWVRPDNRNAFALNHEQRHFDLAKIQSERFKTRILAASLTPDNYEEFMGPLYLETLHQLTRLQEQYDGETRHGTDPVRQEEWNRKIDQELLGFGLKN
ncbi:MAG TPA: hypothetical protein VGE15_08440 [Sphingobacteriaceae bacterium]